MSVYDEIRAERAEQDAKWGGPEHDDHHNPIEWVQYILAHLARAACSTLTKEPKTIGETHSIFISFHRHSEWSTDIFRRQMIRVGALSVACVESIDRLRGEQKTSAAHGAGESEEQKR